MKSILWHLGPFGLTVAPQQDEKWLCCKCKIDDPPEAIWNLCITIAYVAINFSFTRIKK